MEWITKWDWENHEIFSSKVITSSPKKLQSTNYGMGMGIADGDDDIDGSFNLSGVVGGSASDMGNSSVSASTESSFKDGTGIGIKVSEFQFQSTTAFPNTFKKEIESPPLLEPSVSSGEAFIGLKLGKRTYFENNNSTTSSVSTAKKVKPCSQTTPTRCQVEGCNLDLSSAKEYHRKHRVCESHSKSPKVIVSGVERRFCQQCSRFHGLSEFDEKKRSCRRRLSDHNARRRKPQQETIQFNSTNLSSSFYGGRQNLSFVLNAAGPVIQSRGGCGVNQTWENSNMPATIGFNRSVPLKGTRVELLDQGFKDESANVDALRALSLLSNNNNNSSSPWGGLYDHHPDLLPPPDHHNPQHLHTDNPIPSVPIGVPLPLPLHSPDYWQPDIDPSPKTTTPTQFQEFQLFSRFYG